MFSGNLERILKSIKIAKERGCKLRIGPELEITYVHALIGGCGSLIEVTDVVQPRFFLTVFSSVDTDVMITS